MSQTYKQQVESMLFGVKPEHSAEEPTPVYDKAKTNSKYTSRELSEVLFGIEDKQDAERIINDTYSYDELTPPSANEFVTAPGRKDDSGKPRPMLLPFKALNQILEVLEYGAKKYGPDNWRRVDFARNRYLNAAGRHYFAHGSGELRDKESGIYHLAHAAVSIMFALEFYLNETEE